jgi:hypothetical protein
LTPEDRTVALTAFGFTPRQASFLATVIVHAGVCVQRQYATFAGIASGQKVRDFFDELERRRLANAYACTRPGSRIYHVHHKSLYRAIGEPDNRHRRAATLSRAIQRLMVLDVVVSQPRLPWLATESEKVNYFLKQRGLTSEELPRLVFKARGVQTIRYFPEKLPFAPGGHHDELLLVYVATDPEAQGLRAFLDRHRTLLQRLQRWTLLIAVPSFLTGARGAHEAAVNSFAAPAIRLSLLEEFRWYCRARKATEEGNPPSPTADLKRYTIARQTFGADRFFAAYRQWLQDGDQAIDHLASSRLYDAFQRGDSRLEFHVLPHNYYHLASAVAIA